MRLITGIAILTLACFAAADQSVYTTKLENGWQSWSWAKTGMAGKTISVKSKAWQAAWFHHGAQKASAYSAIVFSVKSDTPGAEVQVMVTADGKAQKGEYVFKLPKTLTKITVPMSTFGLGSKSFDGFWLQARADVRYALYNVSLKSK
jgi:hypothetical protein